MTATPSPEQRKRWRRKIISPYVVDPMAGLNADELINTIFAAGVDAGRAEAFEVPEGFREVAAGLIRSFREVERKGDLYDAATHRWVTLLAEVIV